MKSIQPRPSGHVRELSEILYYSKKLSNNKGIYVNYWVSKLSSSRTGSILVVVLIVGAVFAYAIPVIPVTYEESYQVQVPYTWIDEKEETIGSVNDRTVEGGYYIYWNSYIHVRRDV